MGSSLRGKPCQVPHSIILSCSLPLSHRPRLRCKIVAETARKFGDWAVENIPQTAARLLAYVARQPPGINAMGDRSVSRPHDYSKWVVPLSRYLGTYLGRVAHENVVALRVGLVSSRCFPHPPRIVALLSTHSLLSSRTHCAGIAFFCSLNVLFL